MQHKIIKVFLFLYFILMFPNYSQALLLTPDYISLIQQKVNSLSVYPQEAQIKGWEGIVKVRFTLGADGRIKELSVVESSGYPLLDAAATLAIQKASPYPFPKDFIGKGELEVVLPIHYVRTAPSKAVAKATAPSKAPAVMAPSKEAPTAAPKEETLAPPADELTSFIDLALKNNQPTKVALEEVQLARLKVVEAWRGFLPSVKVTSYTTTGEISNIDTEEKETKVQADQPLFSGGRLTGTLKQSQVNLEITRKNYDRLKLDVTQKTETAYYNLLAAKMHSQYQIELVEESEEMFDKIKKLADSGMVIPLEITSAEAWLEQLKFQMESIKQDYLMAELTFQQVLNTKETPEFKMELGEPKKLDLDLEACQEIARKNRPEIFLSKLLVKFNEYGQKVEASKNNGFSVDLTSSYGAYQGHYKTEPWKKATNWYWGFKVTKPFGPSSFNASYTQGRSDPTLGQTTPTASSTLSGEFDLLDNFKRVSDKRQADINLKRSLSDYNETEKTIAFEVRDAFLNYQKALLQLSSAQSEKKFRRNELEVTKIRAMVGEASLSSAMSTLVTLSDALTKYIQAMANYHISLANLKKAAGYGLQI